MSTTRIFLHSNEDVRKVAAAANRYRFPVHFISGGSRIDASSVMGMFSLDLSQPILVECTTEDDSGFLEEIREFIV